VPHLHDKGSSEPTAGITTTRWQSAATKNALDTATPRISWKPSKHIKQRPRNEDYSFNKSYNDYSWAPHLYPQDPHKLHPYPPELSLDSDSSDDEDGDLGDISDTSGKENSSHGNKQNSMEDLDRVIFGRHTDSDMVEMGIGESSMGANLRQSSLQSNELETTEALCGTTNPDTTTDHNRIVVSNNTSDNSSGDQHDVVSQGSAKQSAALDDNMERGRPTGDFTTFLVDAEDTFQVFDVNWKFSPSRGTLCVLCLVMVLALEGVAVGLYFVLR
jgi:hypothetical protein